MENQQLNNDQELGKDNTQDTNCNQQNLEQSIQTDDLVNTIEQQLIQAQNEIKQYQDLWLRSKAEIENIKRRNLEDLERTRKFCIEQFAESLLGVMDSLQAALNDNSGAVETIKQGVELTFKQLQSAFDKHKITSINPINEFLDTNYHQAISTIASDKASNTILEVVQKGYLLADRLLRPALVVVSSGN